MIGATDYVGISAVIASVGAAIVSVVVAFRQTGTNEKVDQVHDAVRTTNGTTIGELASAQEQRRDKSHDAAG